jgi:thioredoxin reductase (NADPH)
VSTFAMPLPVLLVIDGDQDALEDVAAQLVRRYGRDYRVERASDPEQALGALAELADAGDELALVLAATSLSDATGGGLLQRARQLHPHAKRGLMVAQGAWADPPTAETIVDSIAMGRIDYYVPVPANAPDEVFHHTISTFLLEWATERRKVPHTV